MGECLLSNANALQHSATMVHLSIEERHEISRGLIAGETQKSIALALGRSPATISREIARNGGSRASYRSTAAHRIAIDRRADCERPKKIKRPELFDRVVKKLELNWSPEQISETFKRDDGCLVISHQSIYNYLWSLEKNHAHRRSMRRRGRRPRKAKPAFLAKLDRRRSIHDRPRIASDRKRLGDWELDLMTCGGVSGYLITAVERVSKLTLIRKVSNKSAGKVRDGILKMFEGIERSMMKTFTFDNGTEFYYHESLEQQLNVKAYFADPYNSGQRGTNENTNGLIRQYFPKSLHYGLISYWAVRRALG